jgi:outer membrane protein assembly factor BamB
MLRRTTIILALLVLVGRTARADDWPAFRGPAGNGISRESDFPLTWSREENVKWKAELPGPGNSSPIVAHGRVFVTCAEDQGRKRSLYCYDRASGNRLWVRTVSFDKVMPTHKTSPYCGSTPVAGRDRVVVWHSSAGLYCYDLDGRQLWSCDLGEFRHMWGYGSSPVLYKNRVVLNCGPGKRVFLAAVDLDTGETI